MFIIEFSILFCFFFVTSDTEHSKTASVNEVFIKEELIDDAVDSVKSEQYYLIKKEESIDVKHEPLLSEDEPCTSLMVSALRSSLK
jgi:Ni,Fe-hydrogenase I cytochrome b subunit